LVKSAQELKARGMDDVAVFEVTGIPGPLLLDGPNLQARSFSGLTSRGREPEFHLKLGCVIEGGVTRTSVPEAGFWTGRSTSTTLS
jgi:hypothetical protein